MRSIKTSFPVYIALASVGFDVCLFTSLVSSHCLLVCLPCYCCYVIQRSALLPMLCYPKVYPVAAVLSKGLPDCLIIIFRWTQKALHIQMCVLLNLLLNAFPSLICNMFFVPPSQRLFSAVLSFEEEWSGLQQRGTSARSIRKLTHHYYWGSSPA